MPDPTPYVYLCTKHHEVTTPKAITQCPAYSLGQPCPGTLKQVSGPRKKEVTK